MNKRNIWKYAQNKPTQIVRDLQRYLKETAPKDIVYITLLKRGVFKWLAVRRQLIKLKNSWKDRVRMSIEYQKEARADKDWAAFYEERGFRRGVEQCRKEVRKLCHSDRWQAPDHDRLAKHFLKSRGE